MSKGAEGLGSSLGDLGTEGVARISSGGEVGEFGKDFAEGDELTIIEDDYEIDAKELAHGGMGVVHRGRHRRLNRLVAMKFIKLELSKNPIVRKRFLSEARGMCRVRHNNIVQVFDVGLSKDERLLMELEFVEGPSKDGRLLIELGLVKSPNLASYLQYKGKLPASEAVDLALQVCNGLAQAHREGIIHRDIKPSNILLTKDGVPKLADFGLARDTVADVRLSTEGQVLGTLLYMSPEQKEGKKADERSDLYSLAVTLYEMVTGQTPHVIRLDDRIDPCLRVPLGKALEENPDNRYQCAKQFIDAFRAATVAAPIQGDLAPGQCLSCGRTNTSDRQICSHCGAKLLEPCLRCKTTNPVWERFCNNIDCGANLPELIAEQQGRVQKDKLAIESFCNSFCFADAIKLLEALAALDHPRFVEEAASGKDTLEKCRKQLAEQQSRREQVLRVARECYQAFDDRQVINLLEGEPVKDDQVVALLEQARAREREAKELATTIRTNVKKKLHDGLERKVQRLLELRPEAPGAYKLLRELSERNESRQLAQEIDSSVAHKEYLGLLPKVERLVQLKPFDQRARNLLARLQKWEKDQEQGRERLWYEQEKARKKAELAQFQREGETKLAEIFESILYRTQGDPSQHDMTAVDQLSSTHGLAPERARQITDAVWKKWQKERKSERNRVRQEAEAKLAQFFRHALDRNQGKPSAHDNVAADELARTHGIPARRSDEIFDEVCDEWHDRRQRQEREERARQERAEDDHRQEVMAWLERHPPSPGKIIGFAMIGGLLGIVAGIILGLAALIVVGLGTWSSNTGNITASLTFIFVVAAGSFGSGVYGWYCRPTYEEYCVATGKRHKNDAKADLFMSFTAAAVALAMLIGWIIALGEGWIGWWGTILLLFLSMASGGICSISVKEWTKRGY